MRGVTALLLLGVLGCPKQLQSPSVTPRALRLLAETPERETTQLTELRPDLEIDTQDFDRTPHVVATGETPLFSVEGVDVRLFGDEAGSKGFQVDNVILLEVLAADGTVLRTVVIGYSDAVLQGNETLDYLGRRAFGFDAGELNLASILPEKGLV